MHTGKGRNTIDPTATERTTTALAEEQTAMDSNGNRDLSYPESPPLASEATARVIGLFGAAAAAVALIAGRVAGSESASDVFTALRVILCVGGMLTAGIAITLNYRSPHLWLIAAGTFLLAGFGFPQSWDTFRLAARAFVGVAVMGAILIALPLPWRMGIGSGLVMLHFGGIFVAVTSPDPAPLLTRYLWAVLYRPYLQFVYLNNAYQFYSPDPGPASEAWFCIYYEPKIDDPVKIEKLEQTADGQPIRDKNGQFVYKLMTDSRGELAGEPIYDSSGNFIFKEQKDSAGNVLKKPVYLGDEQKPDYLPIVSWLKLPKRDRDYKDPLGQAYYRRLSLTEQLAHFTPLSNAHPVIQNTLTERRLHAKNIPFDLVEWPMSYQCLIPNPDILVNILPSYIRHIARQNQNPDRPISAIKAYRIMHNIVIPDNLTAMWKNERVPVRLKDPITYYPYYLGEFNTKGELLAPADPLLYWLIPIRRNPNARPEDFKNVPAQMTLEEYKRLYEDFVYKHAGSHHMEAELKK